MSSKENYKFIIAKNSNYEKYGIEPEIFINLVKEFFDAVGKTVQQNNEKNLAGFCTKSFFEKADFCMLNKIDIFENTCYIKFEMNSPCKIKITSEHVSENGYDFTATLMKIEDDMYASHHFHYFFTDAQLKKLVRFYEGSYLAWTLNERKFCVDLKSLNRNSK